MAKIGRRPKTRVEIKAMDKNGSLKGINYKSRNRKRMEMDVVRHFVKKLGSTRRGR